MHDPVQILLKYWGFDEFRPLQEDIVQSVLKKKDTLALLPTGGGKSICFQVPALAKEGICLVISPLISLMKDQVQNLKSKGIQAIAVYSGMSPREVDIALDNCVYGDVKFLYLSPERIGTRLFQDRLKKMKVSMIAVDEAHCISQWGYDFRPAYLRISELREMLPGVPVIALTATATPEVEKDIAKRLNFPEDHGFFRQSFERKNLAYRVRLEENKSARILRICRQSKGTGIIYVRNRRRTEQVAEFLKRNGISAAPYHAGMPHESREKIQNAWIKDEIRVVVATNAFGMGIDKPDVRFVIHIDLPDSPEAYFQEAGRAGRDGKDSYSIILYNESDIQSLKEAFEASFPDEETIKRVYLSLGNYFRLAVGSGEEEWYSLDIEDLSTKFKLKPVEAWHSIKILEQNNYLIVSEAFKEPSRIRFTVNVTDLYNFQLSHRNLDSFIKLVLRLYPGLFEQFVKIREEDIARRSGLENKQVENYLRYLDQQEILNYIPRSEQPRVQFVHGRVAENLFRLLPEAYSLRKKAAEDRIQTMINYVREDHECRSQLLLAYFGEKTNYRCGICDYCQRMNRLELSNLELESISGEIRELIKKKGSVLPQDLIRELENHDDSKVARVLHWMLENDELEYDAEQKLRLA